MWQDGGVVRVDSNVPELFTPAQTYAPIAAERVFSVDTETLKVGHAGGKERTVLLLTGFQEGEFAEETHANEDMAVVLCRSVLARYGVEAPRSSRLVQRSKEDREERQGFKDGRDGRRESIEPCVAVWFNLEYDLGRIFTRHRHLLKSVFAGADSYRVCVSPRYEIEFVRLVLGSGSHFEWYVRDLRKKRIARVVGIDMTGYWKCSLAKAAKATKVSDKEELDPIFYSRPLESFTAEEWDQFRNYGLGDVRTTRELYLATQILLQTIDARVIRKDGIIPPSAPGAAARIMFARAFDMHPALKHWRRPAAWIEQLACDAYFAGRSFCTRPGLHASMISLDLKSAYPHIMALLPDPVTMVVERVGVCTFDIDRMKLRGAFGVLVVDGESLDDVYPPVRTRDYVNGGRLCYVAGPFQKLAITIPEIVLGVLSGTLRIDRVHQGFMLRGDPSSSFIRATILREFSIKEDPASDKALADMAKLLMNAGYGKFVEVHASEGWIPAVPMPDFVEGPRIAKSIAKIVAEHGPRSGKLQGSGIYWGPKVTVLQRRARGLYDRMIEETIELPGVPAEDRAMLAVAAYVEALDAVGTPARKGPMISAEKFVRRERTYHTGHYFLPCLASQVTGLTSARLCLMARATKAIQGDTDSVHFVVPEGSVAVGKDAKTGKEKLTLDESVVPGIEDYYRVMAEAGYASPRVGADGEVSGGIPGMEMLGIWAVETLPSEMSVCARSKVYSHKYKDAKGKTKYKQAHHAFARFTSMEAEILRRNGEMKREEREAKAAYAVQEGLHVELIKFTLHHKVQYQTRAAPTRLRAALIQNKEPGVFTSEEKTVLLEQDPNTRVDEVGQVHWVPMRGEQLTPKRKKGIGVESAA